MLMLSMNSFITSEPYQTAPLRGLLNMAFMVLSHVALLTLYLNLNMSCLISDCLFIVV